ncbi:MAG: SEL1-like repeat protein [Planctomycetes bacterium]|nr:SEL1-like repeat protein [Planctomycetota bacterium]
MRLDRLNLLGLLLTLLACACASTGGDSYSDDESSIPEVTGASLFARGQTLESQSNQAGAVELYAQSADLGYAPACKRLGEMHYHGQGIAVDHAAAAKWFALGAAHGDPVSSSNLGILYYFGRGVERDLARAAELWRGAAEKGVADAQTNLGGLYFTGEGVAQDYTEALHWMREAAFAGDAVGQKKLALMYANGWGGETDRGQAVHWMHAAATQGDAEAEHYLGIYANSGFGMEADPIDAARWFWKAAAQSNPESREAFDAIDQTLRAEYERAEARGQRYMATVYFEGLGESVDSWMGFRNMLLAAAQDDPKALLATAHCWAEGIGTEKDADRAMKDCLRAANLGYAPALYEYGLMFDDLGGYTRESHAEAVKCYRAAADRGDANAKSMLALEPDFERARGGNAQAQLDLGICFSQTEILRRDFAAASHWLGLASAQDVTDAHLRLARLLATGGDTVTVIGRRTYAPDPGAALPYYRKAAEYGVVAAQVELAKLLVRSGTDFTNLDEAIAWANLASNNGDDSAIDVVQARVNDRRAYELSASVSTYSADEDDDVYYSDPIPDSPCGRCGGHGVLIRERGHFINGHWWGDTYTTCLECNGTGSLWH